MSDDKSRCDRAGRDVLLEHYVTGVMSEREMEQFEEHMLECSDCLNELEIMKDTIDALREHGGEIKKHVSNLPTKQKMTADYDTSFSGERSVFRKASFFLVTCVVAILVSGYLFFYGDESDDFVIDLSFKDRVPAAFNISYLTFGKQRAGSDSVSEALPAPEMNAERIQFQRAMEPYAEFNYSKTVDLLTELEERFADPDNSHDLCLLVLVRELRFYRGVARLAACQERSNADAGRINCLELALSDLENCHRMADEHDLRRRDRDRYFLALANVLLNRNKVARDYLPGELSQGDYRERITRLRRYLAAQNE